MEHDEATPRAAGPAGPVGPAGPAAAPSRLPAAVVGLGLVSLLTDTSSEAIFPLLPAFLTTLGASNAFIGLVEGAAELVANVLKYATGLLADRRARLKPLVSPATGSPPSPGRSSPSRPRPGTCSRSAWSTGWARGSARARATRSSPRDRSVRSAPGRTASTGPWTTPAPRSARSSARACSGPRGAATGPRAARSCGPCSCGRRCPASLALVALALTREPPRSAPPPAARAGGAAPLPPGLRRALLPIALFAFANATDAFILVKLARLDAAPILAPLLWLALHVIKAGTATAGGRLADRYGKRNALALGWTVYAVTWSAVGFAGTVPVLFVLSAVYGVSHGLVEGAERALVAELAEGGGRGKAFGAYNMLVGFAALAASTAFGAAWDRFGGVAAFAGSGAFALVAAAALLALVPRRG